MLGLDLITMEHTQETGEGSSVHGSNMRETKLPLGKRKAEPHPGHRGGCEGLPREDVSTKFSSITSWYRHL